MISLDEGRCDCIRSKTEEHNTVRDVTKCPGNRVIVGQVLCLAARDGWSHDVGEKGIVKTTTSFMQMRVGERESVDGAHDSARLKEQTFYYRSVPHTP